MRKIIAIPVFVFFSSLFMLMSCSCFAKTELYLSTLNGPFAVNATYTRTDPNYALSYVINKPAQNTVALRVLDSVLISSSFSVTLSLRVDYYAYVGGALTTVYPTLSVNYVPGQGLTYKGQDVYTFSGAYKVIVTVLSSTYTGTTPSAGTLQLRSDIAIDRTYTFSNTQAISPTYAWANNLKQMQVNWTALNSAEEYDVEWTTINTGNSNFATISSNINTHSSPDVLSATLAQAFRNNASRITTKNNNCSISVLSTDSLLLIRVRQAQYNPTTGVRTVGNWDYTRSTYYAIWVIIWDEATQNWQYSAAFAEEGKKKEVISYFDGTLRGRQTVTLNNTDNVALAQENIYDDFGRPTASILPAPYKETTLLPYLHYITNFNTNAANNPYNFVNVAGSGGVCEFNPDPLNTATGASRYYSTNNDYKTTNAAYNYIPDAGGYPLSVTQYTADNTGRIKSQGGVGLAFQPGKATPPALSNTTKYYYGKPEQWELDQLFANDAGYAEHYLKNMVIDPNGQVSISYLNASGKTIATALTGLHPATLDSLPSYKPKSASKTQNIHILKPEQFIYNSSTLTLNANTTYLASVTGSDTLKFNIQKLVDYYPGTFKICSDCYYKMTVVVTDDCGNTAATIGAAVTVGDSTANCTTGTYAGTLPVPIGHVGEYNVNIQFAFDNTVIQSYADKFIKKGQDSLYIEKQFNYIKKRYLDSVDVSGCYSDCHTCAVMLGGRSSFVQMLQTKCISLGLDSVSVVGSSFSTWANGVYTTDSTACHTLQATCTYSPCSAIQSVMQDDVSPGGQYALFDASGTPLEPQANVLSEILTGNTAANWRMQFPILPSTDPVYKSNQIVLPDSTITSPNDVNFTLQNLITYWQPAWANKFLPYHPEYCKLKYCDTSATYESWDMVVQQDVNTAAAVPNIVTGGAPLTYSSTNSDHWLLPADPFFKAGAPGYSYYSQMQSDLDSYSSTILGIHTKPNKGLMLYDDFTLYCQDTTARTNTYLDNTDPWTFCVPSTSCRVADREWLTYRQHYFEVKQKYYTILRNLFCPVASNCPVGQIDSAGMPGSYPVVTDFSIKQANGTNTCGTGFQTVSVTHNSGAVSQLVALTLYYPSNLDNSSLTHVIAFNPGDVQKSICVPTNIPITSMGVKSVTWGAGNGYGNDPTYVVKLVTTKGTTTQSCPDHSGYSTDTLIYYSLSLVDGNGNTAYAANPISAVINYTYPICTTGGTPPTVTMTIPVGQSTGGFYVHMQYISTKNYCGLCPAYLNCVSSLTGASIIQGVNHCTGYINTNPQPPTGPCPVAYTIKKARFPDATSTVATQAAGYPVIADSTIVKAPSIAAAKQQAADICAGTATTWISKLQPGLTAIGATSTQISQLTSALIGVCSAGGDQNHPMGTTTLPTGSLPYASFGAAIKAILLGGGNFTTTLNPWLIDAPYPYNVQQQSVAKTISNTNPQLCSILSADSILARNAGKTLYNYLVSTYGNAMTLTAADVKTLQNGCLSCRFILASDITLPVFLDPGATGSISPSAYAAAKTALVAQFGGSLSTGDPNYQTIYSNYMNQQWGFSLTYDDYAAYDALLLTNPSAILCNTVPYTTVPPDPNDCIKNAISKAVINGLADYNAYIANLRQTFIASYINTCKLAQANANLVALQQEYHYTMYYYDQADNLLRTVPPEGVTLVDTSRFSYIDKARDLDSAAYSYTYTGPTSNSSLPTALTTLSNTLSAAQGAVEMWFYNNGLNNYHMVEVTPDNKYLFQAGISGGILSVDVYPLTQPAAYSIKMLPATGHYSANISSMLPLPPFALLVFQGNTLGTGASLPQLYLNGKQLTVNPATIPSPLSFTISAGASSITVPDSIQTLKHLRLYTHLLSAATISADAANIFFNATDTNVAGWYRFNVPAVGAPPTTINSSTSNEVAVYDFFPSYVLPTTYAYNATNQVSMQNSPDGGTNRFWYDLLSRLVISQNDKQATANYSYTNYDAIGRITEVGQKNQTTVSIGSPDYLAAATLTSFGTAGTNSQITDTYYDKPGPTVAGNTNGIATLPGQSNLRKRVAASTYTETQGGPALRATYYNYDLDGNVKTLWQQIDGLYVNSTNSGLKRVDYEYDLVSGKVNFVRYQDGQPDAFYYGYGYDADNRITQAWSSTNATVDTLTGSYLAPNLKKLDARYFYYLHGPLRRMELGGDSSRVQGLDYAYTLQGWLKGVNSTPVTSTADIGLDGSDLSHRTPKDALGYNLYYYNTDYAPIVTTNLPFATTMQTNGSLRQLYNGNITASSVNIPQLTAAAYWVDRIYTYDQLNRIKSATAYHTVNMTSTPVHNGDYDEQFTYDGNGNILTLNRAGSGTGTLQDNMVYKYNLDGNNRLINNRLNYLNGHAAASNIMPDQALNNYTYDAIGDLTADVQAGITGINWSVYGKIQAINKASGNILYTYNPAGERVSKKVGTLRTWYIRDAQGNTLAVYDSTTTAGITWREQHLYGSSRLGMWTPNVKLSSNNALAVWDTAGRKQYELNNHLGNVLATISDKRVQHTTNGTSLDYYVADIATAQDYYAFGSLMPGRTYSYTSNYNYRYGFNGKENDNDVGKGIGNEQDYGMRIYDPRVGRFLSVDPIASSYPWYTPYQFAGNSPTENVDLDGKEDQPYWVQLLKSWVGLGSPPKNADEANQQSNERAAVQQVFNNVDKLADAEENTLGIVPGVTEAFELQKGNTKTAAGYLILDVFGEEIFGRVIKGVKYLHPDELYKITENGVKIIGKNTTTKLGKIITSGIQHGTNLHWETMNSVAKVLSEKGETVYLNKTINTALGKTIEGIGKLKPDIISIGEDGVIHIVEVVSPSQKAKQLYNKTLEMSKSLIKKGYTVTTTVVEQTGEIAKP